MICTQTTNNKPYIIEATLFLTNADRNRVALCNSLSRSEPHDGGELFQQIGKGPVKIYAQNCLQAPAE